MFWKPPCVPLISVIETSQYGTLLHIMVIIFSFLVSCPWALVPHPLLRPVSWNVTALAVGGVCVPHSLVLDAVFSSRLQIDLLLYRVFTCCSKPSASLGMQLYANFPVSAKHWQVTAKILGPLATEEGSFWAVMGEKGRVWACCCFLFLLSSGRGRSFSWDGALMLLEMQPCHIIISNF